MNSSSGLSSNSCELEGDMQELMDTRKRKRMISNRESARRSRLKKQRYIDDLTAQVARLSTENSLILRKSDDIRKNYFNVEAENSILRARVAELNHYLHSLKEIVSFMSFENGGGSSTELEPANEMDELAWVVNTWLQN